MKKLFDEIKKFTEMSTSKEKRKQFNDDMVKKTMDYQRKFGFELNPRPKHELWNVEGDAFKHTFGSADMALDMGSLGSRIGGIFHESQTKNNPQNEWNMDSWNNAQGRNIAKEIKKEYGDKLKNMPQKERDAIIATKVIMKMRNGDLITHPDDKRKFNGPIEKFFNPKSQPTGQAAPIENQQPFTRQQIGAMSSDEFTKNEPMIMEQLKNGQIKDNMFNLDNLNNSRIFTREDIAGMTSNEYSKQEPQIMEQWKSIGIPTNNEMQNNSGAVYIQPYTKSDGTEVKGYYRKR